MDEKMIEQEYKKLKQQAAPDLWSRIEMNLAEHPERDAKAVQTGDGRMASAQEPADPGKRGKTLRRIPAWRPAYGVAAAAALVVVSIFASRQVGNKSMAPEMMMQETMAAAEAAPMLPEQEEAGAVGEIAAGAGSKAFAEHGALGLLPARFTEIWVLTNIVEAPFERTLALAPARDGRPLKQ